MQVSAKLRSTDTGFAHWCPACETMHRIWVPQWSFDGNVESPTFSPSVKVTYPGRDADTVRPGGKRAPSACCHYHLRAGRIEFQNDCSHSLNSQTVPLPDLPPECRDT